VRPDRRKPAHELRVRPRRGQGIRRQPILVVPGPQSCDRSDLHDVLPASTRSGRVRRQQHVNARIQRTSACRLDTAIDTATGGDTRVHAAPPAGSDARG
jgi:hypothetical protein